MTQVGQQQDGQRGHEHQGRRDQRGHGGMPQRTERTTIPDRGPVPQPHDTTQPADGAGGDDGHGDPQDQQPHDPGSDVTDRAQPAVEQVERRDERLGAHERDTRRDAEGGAVEDIVESLVGQQDERTGCHQEHGKQRRDDPPDPREVGRAGTRDRAAHHARGLRRHELVQRVAEQRPDQRAPQERECDDPDGLVLVDIDVVHVDDRDQGYQDGGGDDGHREEPQQAQRHDQDRATDKRHLERPDLLAGQGGIQRGDEPHRRGPLTRSRGVCVTDSTLTTPALLRTQRVPAADAPGQVGDLLAALVAADVRRRR